MIIALIPCAPTEWRRQHRVLGRVEIAAASNSETDQALSLWTDAVRALNLARLYHSRDELAAMTARRIGRRLKVATRLADDLGEPDMGLWTGLTQGQLEARYESVYRELEDAPLNVSPPGGEPLEAAFQRICAGVSRRLQKHPTEAIGFVLRPLALAAARICLQQVDASAWWSLNLQPDELLVIEHGAARTLAVAP